MRNSNCVVSRVMAIGAVLVFLAPAVAMGQTAPADWTVPRTPDGHADLQGVWANNSATPMQRPEAWAGKDRLNDEELAELVAAAAEATDPGQDALFGDQLVLAAIQRTQAKSYDPTTGNYNGFWIADRVITNRTSLVVDPPDGRIPAMTPEAQARTAEQFANVSGGAFDSHASRPLPERCISYGMPNLQAGYNSYYQIAQADDYAVIVQEMIHDARAVPIDGRPHPPESIRLLHGDSVGHWEGDTLVVETTNYKARGGFFPTTERLVVTERFTRVGPESLQHQITFDDPSTWTQPWTLEVPLQLSPEAIFEYACHEGNYGMEGMLAGGPGQGERGSRHDGGVRVGRRHICPTETTAERIRLDQQLGKLGFAQTPDPSRIRAG